MSKYVNADKLTQVLQGIRVSGAKVLDFNDALDWVCDVIGELPFIEIVRCKDCIKYKPSENENYPCGECGNCGYDVPPRIVQEDGFCNEAERKETE